MAESSSTSGDILQTSSPSVPPPSSVISTSFGHPLSTVLPVKLDEKNYLLWRGMVLPILRGQKVDDFVMGTKVQPPEVIEVVSEEGKKSEMNPLYVEWCLIDQALCGWLFGSMTPAIAAEVVSFGSSREVWKALEKIYGASSKARINQLRGILQNTKKGGMSMSEYLTIMRQAAENLQLAGNPISIDDQVSFALAGLDSEYIPIVCIIEGKEISTWLELSSLLLQFEGTLARLSPHLTETGDISANYAYRQGSASD